jgi:prepilin-type N-terminal cleavage/methylation domain-containing protein
MMFKRLGSIMNKRQRGFTLIELIIAVAITGAITSGITMSIFQTFNYNARSNARMVAVKQVEEAIHYINRDVQMAQIIEPEPDPDPDGFPLVLTWVEWETNSQNVVTYSLDDSTNELKRKHDAGGSTVSDRVVASYVDTSSDDTYCEFDDTDWIFTFKITATVSGYPEDMSETREVRVTPRTS